MSVFFIPLIPQQNVILISIMPITTFNIEIAEPSILKTNVYIAHLKKKKC